MELISQYQLLPSLTDEEYQSLKDDIAKRGVQVPIEFDEIGNVLDGHHRLKICDELKIKDYPSIVRVGLSEEEKFYHVLALNLDRRHLSGEQRKELHIKLRERGLSLRQIADRTHVSYPTVSRDLAGVTNVTPQKITGADGKQYPSVINKNKRDAQRTFSALQNLDPSDLPDEISDSKAIKKLSIDKSNAEKRANAALDGEVSLDTSIVCGDFRIILENFPENSVDLIFTDPPYDEESIPLYGDLARLGARVLKPGGSLIAYAGHYALPKYFELMTPYLRYWWIIALEHGGNSARLIGKNVFVGWKPLLWFVKDSRGNQEYVSDLFKSQEPDKEAQDWQQDTSEAEYYIEHLTDPSALILDPFCGSGTTIIAARKVLRKGIGIEIDNERANIAKSRIDNITR